jgi:hypothetical protein
MDTREMQTKIAVLESKVDQLESELAFLNEKLIECGFPEGIATLKMTIEEMIAEDAEHTTDR